MPGLVEPAGEPVVLPRSFYARSSLVVAPELLHKLLVHGDRAGRIVEVEAYCGADDPGSHAFRGRTPRNATMFGPAGLLYVYFTYGMHWCANAVCGDEGDAVAVLVRAVAPTRGLDAIKAARPRARRDADLTNGPAKVCQAFGIDGSHDGADLVSADRGITVTDDGTQPPEHPGTSTRIGLSRGADLAWRWFVPGDPNLSRRSR